MNPSESALLRDVAAPAFMIGERRGKWTLKGVRFPHALFFIAAPPRAKGPIGFLLKSECSGYSGTAPTSQLWHGGNNAPLADTHRPKNAQGGTLIAFNTWGLCLYHPIDRLARDHGQWPTTHPELLWTPDKDITFLLETVHAILNTSEYAGADLPAAALELPHEFVAADIKSTA
jgi:hypothetical protein